MVWVSTKLVVFGGFDGIRGTNGGNVPCDDGDPDSVAGGDWKFEDLEWISEGA